MKQGWIRAFVALLLSLLFMTACASPKGVDELRGQWEVNMTFEDGGVIDSLYLFLNDFQAGQDPNTYLAVGCMRSPESGVMMPVALNTVYASAEDNYSLSIYATFVPPPEEGPPWVVRFNGNFELNGRGISDDLAYGEFRSDPGTGTWQATHHDRRRTECPSVDLGGERLNMDIYAHRDSPDGHLRINLGAGSIHIVSSALQITAPDGEVFIAEPYTDMFSPEVDFINEFGFAYSDDTTAIISGAPYEFVLLDAFNRPIAGTEAEDIWTGCFPYAPIELTANPDQGLDGDILLSWTGVPEVTGEFEPGVNGFYQVEIHLAQGQAGEDYGANWIASHSHVIPWDPFVPGESGSDGVMIDGQNYGVSLSEFGAGEYNIDVKAMYFANPNNGGFGFECGTRDDEQDLTLIMDGSGFTIIHPDQ